jgi:hypothetical protein
MSVLAGFACPRKLKGSSVKLLPVVGNLRKIERQRDLLSKEALPITLRQCESILPFLTFESQCESFLFFRLPMRIAFPSKSGDHTTTVSTSVITFFWNVSVFPISETQMSKIYPKSRLRENLEIFDFFDLETL